MAPTGELVVPPGVKLKAEDGHMEGLMSPVGEAMPCLSPTSRT